MSKRKPVRVEDILTPEEMGPDGFSGFQAGIDRARARDAAPPPATGEDDADPHKYEPFDNPDLGPGFWVTNPDGSCGGFVPYRMAVAYGDEVHRLRAQVAALTADRDALARKHDHMAAENARLRKGWEAAAGERDALRAQVAAARDEVVKIHESGGRGGSDDT